jgi:mRNA-degrading endonuclease HigB of HigAB toxin-antitoxin module
MTASTTCRLDDIEQLFNLPEAIKPLITMDKTLILINKFAMRIKGDVLALIDTKMIVIKMSKLFVYVFRGIFMYG